MTWVPENERTPDWYVFNVKFMCKVRRLDTLSIEEIKMFGMPMSGDAEFDRTMANEIVTRLLTINEMVEYYRRGVTVAICKPADTKIIYERVRDHLTMWTRHMQKSLNIGNAPLEDLKAMDTFVNAVYMHAQHHYQEEFVESLLARKLLGGGMPIPAVVTAIDKAAKHEEEQSHESIAQVAANVSAKKPLSTLFAQRRKTGEASWK